MRKLFLTLAMLACSGVSAQQHDEHTIPHNPLDSKHWYPTECCNLTDCFPLEEGDVIERDGGFYIQSTKEHFKYNETRPSGDNRFHRCDYQRQSGTNTIRRLGSNTKPCFFVPTGGT